MRNRSTSPLAMVMRRVAGCEIGVLPDPGGLFLQSGARRCFLRDVCCVTCKSPRS